ncbi:MAG: hypothetical protein ACRDGD_00635 [Candidatus Limnocylindria bacterium]
MTDEVVARISRSSRYRDVDPVLVNRLASEELPHARSTDDAVKRVKRRLHQAVGAFRGASDVERVIAPIRTAWSGDPTDSAFRDACRVALAGHASTRERVGHLDRFYASIWRETGGPPASLLDLGCGLAPLALPWMDLEPDAAYLAVDVDHRPLAAVDAFLSLVAQPHRVEIRDLVAQEPPPDEVGVAFLLKTVTTLDRQDPDAVARLIRNLRARHAVVSFAARSLSGHDRGMERTYRSRMDRLTQELGARVAAVAEASVPNELAFVLTLDGDG